MSALRLAVLVVLGATCCVTQLTNNPVTPERTLADEMKNYIEDELQPLKHAIEEVKRTVKEMQTAQKASSKVEQDVKDELRGVGEKVEEVLSRVGGLKSDLEAQLPFIGRRVEELTNTTQLIVDAMEEELEKKKEERAAAETVPTYPCLDSTFSDSINNTCQLAVRFRRCSLTTVSYHCCRTCTDAGLLPETGPWRHQNLPRIVTNIETLRLVAP